MVTVAYTNTVACLLPLIYLEGWRQCITAEGLCPIWIRLCRTRVPPRPFVYYACQSVEPETLMLDYNDIAGLFSWEASQQRSRSGYRVI